ncbi:MAG: PIG-L family deacetylase [Caldilineaceae bacterium]|nr:PIG-L family deacetylase [Caldilineaceae bacterium]
MTLRILSIGAHPADIFDQSGGTMAHHVKRGDIVGCVVLTHGARIHDAVISDAMFHKDEVPDASELQALMHERSDVKAEETRRACALLGVEDVTFFGADDAVLLVNEDLVRRLARLLREKRPDIILTHYPKESDGLLNPHAVAGQIVLGALSLAASVDPGDRNPPHKTAQVFFFGTGAASIRRNLWDATGGYTNDVFIDIGDVVELKLAAIDCMVSQGYGGAYARKRIETSDGAFGNAGGVAYAEAFISLHAETHYYLPVTDYALEGARASDHELITKRSYKLAV